MSAAVAVTGIGVVSPIGIGRTAFWNALAEGRSGITPIEGLAASSGLPRIGASVGDFPARDLITSPQLRRMDPLSRMAVASIRNALDYLDGRLDPADSSTSDWIGEAGLGAPRALSGNGAPIIGIHGRRAAVFDALGIVLAEK